MPVAPALHARGKGMRASIRAPELSRLHVRGPGSSTATISWLPGLRGAIAGTVSTVHTVPSRDTARSIGCFARSSGKTILGDPTYSKIAGAASAHTTHAREHSSASG